MPKQAPDYKPCWNHLSYKGSGDINPSILIFKNVFLSVFLHRHKLLIDLREKQVLVMGWLQSQDVTAARLEARLPQLGPTLEQVLHHRDLAQLVTVKLEINSTINTSIWKNSLFIFISLNIYFFSTLYWTPLPQAILIFEPT